MTTEVLTPARAVALLRAHGTVAHRDGLYKVNLLHGGGASGWLTERELLALAEKEEARRIAHDLADQHMTDPPIRKGTGMRLSLSSSADTEITTVLMTADEARNCVARIRMSIESARRDILDLHDREGWKALGYATWRDCASAELGMSVATVYRYLEAATIERETDFSQIEKNEPIPTTQLQALKDTPPDQRPAVIERANEIAGSNKRTTAHVKQAVEEEKPTTSTTPPCEECGRPSTSKQNIGGVSELRCDACTALAEQRAAEDAAGASAEDAPFHRPDRAVCDRAERLGAQIDYAGQRADGRLSILPPATHNQQWIYCDASELAQLCDAWERPNAQEAEPAIDDRLQTAIAQTQHLLGLLNEARWSGARHTLRLLCRTMEVEVGE